MAGDETGPPLTPPASRRQTSRILVIAGSDSGGGAGIQADIKTITMLGGHAMTAVTAITAQNTLGVRAVMPVPATMVRAQIDSVVGDIGVDAVKIGMLGSAETAAAVADWLENSSSSPRTRGPIVERSGWAREREMSSRVRGDDEGGRVPVVFDPVMVATSGDALADAATIAAFERLMALATVVTPNLPELAALGGEAAVRASGAALLVKGGHGEGADLVDRLVDGGGVETRWTAPRIDTRHTHGTGCTLASAIATGLARGLRLVEAVAQARAFVRLALHDAPGLGGGHGPMGHGSVRLDLGAGPRLNQATLPGDAASVAFYAALGLVQIVATDHGYARFETPGGATLSIEAPSDAGGGAPTLFLECDDLDATLAALAERGIHASPPVDQPWGWREARLTDPAGNALCLYRAGEMRRFPPWRLRDA